MAFFHQSERWEAFQRSLGRTTARIGGQLAIRSTTPLGSYWYVPRPSTFDPVVFITHAKSDRAMFVRVDPSENYQLSTINYQLRPTAPTQPQDSLILSLEPTTEELLASFHEKTRYNIRLAEKRGVTTEESTDQAGLEAFLGLAAGTASRQEFRYHTSKYYQTMLETLGSSLITNHQSSIAIELLVARHNERPIAALIVLHDTEAKTAYYLHGASSYVDRSLMAPHLLQWAAIQRAKERGFKDYDFWGIAPPTRFQVSGSSFQAANQQSDPKTSNLKAESYHLDAAHPWAGVTRFKLGFGGEVVHYPDSFDLVLNPTLYSLYAMGRRIRRQLPI